MVNRRYSKSVEKKNGLLSDEALEMIAQRFAVLGEPMRLRLLHALTGGERHVGALVEASGGTQANVSRHLQTLAQAGIVSRRKQGLQVFYGIADPTIFDLCEVVCTSISRQVEQKARALAAPPGEQPAARLMGSQ